MPTDADPRSDAELLAATRGDVEAFGVFYQRHVRGVLGAVARRTGDPELAADVASEAFAQAMLASHRYDARRGDPTAWLFGIVKNTLAAGARRGAAEDRARRKLGMEIVEVEPADVRWIEALVRADAGREAMGHLAQLPDSQRTLVVAHVIGERSYRELATAGGIPEATVRQRVSRGLRALRTRLQQEGPSR
jgi:RNA polymerase sigma factor (sigma-70 family)